MQQGRIEEAEFTPMRVDMDVAMSRLSGEFVSILPAARVAAFSGSCFLGGLHVTNAGPAKWILVMDKEGDGEEGPGRIVLRIPARADSLVHVSGPIRFLNGILVASSSSPHRVDPSGTGDDLYVHGHVFSAVRNSNNQEK